MSTESRAERPHAGQKAVAPSQPEAAARTFGEVGAEKRVDQGIRGFDDELVGPKLFSGTVRNRHAVLGEQLDAFPADCPRLGQKPRLKVRLPIPIPCRLAYPRAFKAGEKCWVLAVRFARARRIPGDVELTDQLGGLGGLFLGIMVGGDGRDTADKHILMWVLEADKHGAEGSGDKFADGIEKWKACDSD